MRKAGKPEHEKIEMFVELGLRKNRKKLREETGRGKPKRMTTNMRTYVHNGPENRLMACGEHSTTGRHQRDQRGPPGEGQNHWGGRRASRASPCQRGGSWRAETQWGNETPCRQDKGEGNRWHWKRQRSTARNMPEMWCYNCETRKAIYRTEAIKNAKFMWRKWEARSMNKGEDEKETGISEESCLLLFLCNYKRSSTESNINVGNYTCILMNTPVRDGNLPRILLLILFCIHTG